MTTPDRFDPSTLPGYRAGGNVIDLPGEKSIEYSGSEELLEISWVAAWLHDDHVESSFRLPLDILTADQVRAILTANRCPVEQS